MGGYETDRKCQEHGCPEACKHSAFCRGWRQRMQEELDGPGTLRRQDVYLSERVIGDGAIRPTGGSGIFEHGEQGGARTRRLVLSSTVQPDTNRRTPTQFALQHRDRRLRQEIVGKYAGLKPFAGGTSCQRPTCAGTFYSEPVEYLLCGLLPARLSRFGDVPPGFVRCGTCILFRFALCPRRRAFGT